MSAVRSIIAAAGLALGAGCTCAGTLQISGSDGGARPGGGGHSDGGAPDASLADASVPDASVRSELCGNLVDDDGDGLVDEGCSCTVGAQEPCSSPDGGSTVGACRPGTRVCEPTGEFGAWSVCRGEVLPTAERCNGVDDDCDGTTDDLTRGCSTACGTGAERCSAGAWGSCSAPQPGAEVCNGLDDDCDGLIDEGVTRGCSGVCGAGLEVCSAGAWGACNVRPPAAELCNGLDDDCNGAVDDGLSRVCSSQCGAGVEVCAAGQWSACSARQPSQEICGNGVDEDCNGADLGCTCIRSPSQTPWQIHLGEPPTCWPQAFSSHGAVGEYQYSTVPPENDSGWGPHAAPNISFDDPSTMCGVNGGADLCTCRAGGDFTYFQTSFDIASGYQVQSLVVSIANVDDGVRVTLFNANNPGGYVAGHAFLGGGTTADMGAQAISGRNRIVLSHVDDCCSVRRIQNATITLNGTALNPCP